MNRRLLIVPIVGVAALAGTQFLGGESELPPEPTFPTVVNQRDAGWTDDAWSVNRFVDDPFDATQDVGFDPGTPLDAGQAADDPEADALNDAAPGPATTGAAGSSPAQAAAPAPTTTTAPAPTTTIRDLSQAPPLADDGSGVDLPAIDDLPDPLGAGSDADR